MIIAHVSVKTKENTHHEFERILSQIQNDVRKMTGCIKNEWYRAPDSPQHYVVYGEFDSERNFDDYLNSPAVKRIGEELIPLLCAPPEFKHFTATLLDAS